ncbi:MAG: hypothetical protein ACQEUT_10120 [Bacillota bacterium]
MNKYYAAAAMLVLLILLAGCGNKIEMVEDASVSISEDEEQMIFTIILDDVNMDPETPFQVRIYASNGELVRALGKDLFVFDEEYISHKEGEESKVIEITETLPLTQELSEEKLKEIIEDNDDTALEIDVLNNEKVFATEEIQKVR